MSEVEAGVAETGPIGVDDVLQAIQQKNIGRAKAAFQDIMGQKVNAALESEKVAIANQVFNPQTDIAPTAAEIIAADAEETEESEEELSIEDEVQAAFEEEEDAEVS